MTVGQLVCTKGNFVVSNVSITPYDLICFDFLLFLYYGVDNYIGLMATNLIYIQSLMSLRDYMCILFRKKNAQKYREEGMEQKAITHF